MGQNGRLLVEENYSIQAVAKQMIQLYEWVLGEVPRCARCEIRFHAAPAAR